MAEVILGLIGALLSIVLYFLQKQKPKEDQALEKEREAYDRIEKANRDILRGNVDDLTRSLDDTLEHITSIERLRRKIAGPNGGSNPKS